MFNLKKFLVASLMLFVLPLMLHAQQPKLIKVSEFGVSHIKAIEERVFLVHSIMEKGYYCFSNADVPGTIEVYMANDASDELSDFDFFFDNVLYEQLNEFSHLDKNERGELFVQWRQDIDDEVFRTLYEDFTRGLRTENATCETALPFCTNMGLYVFPAGVNSGSPCGDTYNAQCSEPYKCTGAHQGQDNCLSTAPNPAFYYMRIDEPGNLNIYMYTTPPEDLDFDCWGPFEDMNTACDLLSCSNMVDCSYSADPTEHCHINGALTGQYYILLITNYSNSPCNISFENVGTGTTDCSILPPLVSGGGPYCVGETIHLTAQNQPGATFSWTGPNGFSSTEQNPSIPNCTMEMAGIYTCTITIGDESSSAETEFVEVDAMPSADFTFTSACEGDPIQFTSTSTTNPTGQTITNFEWDFGDGQTASGETVSHAFDHYGDYEVTLTVSTGQGVCTDQKTMTVAVYAIPQFNVSATPSSVIYGGIATLTAIVETPGNFTYHWEPANMVTNPNSQTTQTVPITSPQVFTVTVTNELGGCSSSTPVTVSMAGSDLTATATADQYEICENGSTILHALPMAGTGNYTYSWSPANLLNSTTSQNPVATPPVGTTTFTCIVSDGLTEQETSVTILVHAHEESDKYESICENDTYDFFGQPITEAGVYNHTLQNHFGCDSIVHLHLSLKYNTTGTDFQNRCDSYTWIDGNTYYANNSTATYILTNAADCDSIVTLNLQLGYTPDPEITPIDTNNHAPHWVVTATEFQINNYDFYITENAHPTCSWPYPIEWRFVKKTSNDEWVEDLNVQWILEPDSTTNPPGKKCRMYVLNYIEDTIWLAATVKNECAPQGITRRYWFVCSFYGIEEGGASTGIATSNFEVVPNPNNGQMQLRFEYLSGKANIKVYDSRGMLIDSFETYHSDGQFTYPYDMKTTANGIYFFVVTNKEGTVAKKVVIQR